MDYLNFSDFSDWPVSGNTLSMLSGMVLEWRESYFALSRMFSKTFFNLAWFKRLISQAPYAIQFTATVERLLERLRFKHRT